MQICKFCKQNMKWNYILYWELVILSELQVIFESNAHLPPNFLLNADFQNSKVVFSPSIFLHNAEKGTSRYNCFEALYLCFGVVSNIALEVIIIACGIIYIANT